MSTSNGSGLGDLLDELPLASGARFGAVAWAIGLVVVTLLVNVVELDDGFEDNWVEFSAWIFYNAHYVDVTGDGLTVNYLQDDIASFIDWTIPAFGYTLLVLAIIAVAGYVLASNLSVPDGTTGAKAGATVVVGYLPLAVVGSFLFEDDGGSPELATSIFLMGIVFPVALGALGGYIAGET